MTRATVPHDPARPGTVTFGRCCRPSPSSASSREEDAMADTLNRAPNQEYYDRVAALSTVPLWQLGEMHEPSGPERPHVWHWDEVVPELLRVAAPGGRGRRGAAAPGAPVAQPRLDATRLRRHAHAGRRLPDAAARRVGSGVRPLVLGVALRGLGPRRSHGGRRSACPDAPGRPPAHAGLVLAWARAHRGQRARRVVRRARRAAARRPARRLLPGAVVVLRPVGDPRLRGHRGDGTRSRARRSPGRSSLADPPLSLGRGLPGPPAPARHVRR